MKELGVDLLNCMAMFPNVNTPFGNIAQPDKELMEQLRGQGGRVSAADAPLHPLPGRCGRSAR